MEIVLACKGDVGVRCANVLKDMGLDYIPYDVWDKKPVDLLLSVHWPHKFPQEELDAPRIGPMNIHNSYLPWGRGADACAWAIINDSFPHGATFHWMNDKIDGGAIFHQRRVPLEEGDTTDTLYKRTADMEVIVFKHSIELLLAGDRTHERQEVDGPRTHKTGDLDKYVRALTTRDQEVVQRKK